METKEILRDISDKLHIKVRTLLEAKETLKGFTDDGRLNAYIFGLQDARSIVIDAYGEVVEHALEEKK